MSTLERHLQVGQSRLDFIYFRLVGVFQRFARHGQFANVILQSGRRERDENKREGSTL